MQGEFIMLNTKDVGVDKKIRGKAKMGKLDKNLVNRLELKTHLNLS